MKLLWVFPLTVPPGCALGGYRGCLEQPRCVGEGRWAGLGGLASPEGKGIPVRGESPGPGDKIGWKSVTASMLALKGRSSRTAASMRVSEVDTTEDDLL